MAVIMVPSVLVVQAMDAPEPGQVRARLAPGPTRRVVLAPEGAHERPGAREVCWRDASGPARDAPPQVLVEQLQVRPRRRVVPRIASAALLAVAGLDGVVPGLVRQHHLAQPVALSAPELAGLDSVLVLGRGRRDDDARRRPGVHE